MKLDHIGIVVNDLELSKKYYQDTLHFNEFSAVIDEPEKKVKIVFVKVAQPGGIMVELIQPAGEDSAVYNFLKKTGGGLHHLAYEVEDLDKSIEHFKREKALLVGNIYPGAGHSQRRVIWFYTRFRELIELIER